MATVWNLLLTAVIVITIARAESNCTDCQDAQRSIGPMIIPNVTEKILYKGQNYTLTCKGKTRIHFKQQLSSEEVTKSPLLEYNSSISEGDYKFKVVLELVNVDQYAIGYYACHDDVVNGTAILGNLTEEPQNTEHITFIYIYVDGTGNLFAPMREVIVSMNQAKLLIECRPTTPDVNITLMLDTADKIHEQYSPKVGFLVDTDIFKDDIFNVANCNFYRGKQYMATSFIVVKHTKAPSQPIISEGYSEFLAGETFVMNCTVDYESNCAVTLEWNYPSTCPNNTIFEVTNEYNITAHAGTLYRTIKIVNATKAHEGRYTCISKNNCGNKYANFVKKFLDKPYLEAHNLNDPTGKRCLDSKRVLNMVAHVKSYPPAAVSYLNYNKPLPKNSTKYIVSRNSDDWILSIKQVNVADSANYTMLAQNGYLNKTVVFCVRVNAPPNITFGNDQDIKKDRGVMSTFECTVTGIPLPEIEWIFTSEEDNREEIMESTTVTENSVYQETAYLTIPIKQSGNITCKASNVPSRYKEERHASRRLLVYEIPGGFGIWKKSNNWFPENRDVVITCMASKYDFVNVTWIGSYYIDGFVEHSNNSLSLVTKLKLNQISVNQSGAYICRGVRNDGTVQDDTIFITVEAVRPPVIFEPSEDRYEEVILFQPIQLPCQVNSVPPPTLEWFKDDQKLENSTKAKIYLEKVNVTIVNSVVEIEKMAKDLVGTYKCVATSDGVVTERVYKLALKEESYVTILCVILVIISVLILVVAYLTWKIKKEKRFRKELAAAGLLYFKEGVTKSLNPELGIDEQAELLPYDEKFEFPYDSLKLGKQLGSGAFGVVYKAEARGIINAEETTEVAVKMVKKTADNMYIKALASELKIMVHMGKHVNIVNLLGACTKNVGKRELVVIVEYCKFGNIHNYLLRHRDVFIDQLTDNTEKSLGKVNRGYSCSSGSTGMQSDYFGSNTQDTDHTFLNTANTSRGGRKADHPPEVLELVRVSEGYVQPEWRTNYESDYSFDGRAPRQLFSRDLLAWAFQIARGMEYLASRKVLHGDLAARNVLLADDNIVKICDFGLARSIYKDDEYQKKENSLLPVKWLAIECMTDRIFSTQSDVWSFGIVLWELFSLAKTPYPNISPAELLQFLSKGERLEKPTYADDKLYNIMKRCWAQKPTQRPSFSELQEILGEFLEDNVRNHYVDLNSAYTDVNPKPGEEDYLAMVAAPDYNNMVTPSPHHYVNEERFFPPGPTAQLDDEGYLQMSPAKQSIFSPRFQETKFVFDSRHPRVPEPSHSSSELTPMLTLNNLPTRSGSESDHEGNASPYLKMCPKIVEESDEVFVTNKTPELETKQNNEKNALRAGVTNRMYIPFGIDSNKPKDIINNYSNIPNGLVK